MLERLKFRRQDSFHSRCKSKQLTFALPSSPEFGRSRWLIPAVYSGGGGGGKEGRPFCPIQNIGPKGLPFSILLPEPAAGCYPRRPQSTKPDLNSKVLYPKSCGLLCKRAARAALRQSLIRIWVEMVSAASPGNKIPKAPCADLVFAHTVRRASPDLPEFVIFAALAEAPGIIVTCSQMTDVPNQNTKPR